MKIKKLLAVFVALTVLVGSLNFVAFATDDDATGGYGADVSASESTDIGESISDGSYEGDFASDGESDVATDDTGDIDTDTGESGYSDVNGESEYTENELDDNDYKYNGDKSYNDGLETNEENKYEDEYKYEEKYEEEELEKLLVPIMPLNGGFSATITHESNTMAFGQGSQFRIPNGTATVVGQTVRVADNLPTGTVTPAVVIHINQGMELGTVVPGFTGTGHNRVFNTNNLPDHLQGIVTYARWIPADRLEFDITGDWHQPMSGTLVYLLAADTYEVEISVQVRAERVFSQTGGAIPSVTPAANRIHEGVIQAQTFANIGLTPAQLQGLASPTPHQALLTYLAGVPTLNEATLEEYGLVGVFDSRLQPTAPTVPLQVRVLSPGDSWETHIDSRAYVGGGFPLARTMAEEVVITLHLNKNLGIQGVRSRPGSLITDGVIVNPADVFPAHPNLANLEPMLTYTIDRTSNATVDIVTITLVQPRLIAGQGVFVLYGTIPTDAILGTYGSLGLQGASSPVTPLSGGTISNMRQWGFGDIIIADTTIPGEARLSIHPLNGAPQHSHVPTDGTLDWLGGFLLRNENPFGVNNQAVRMFFEDDTIGVQAFRLPVGSDGLGELYVYTTSGRRIYATDSGVLLTSDFSGGINSGGTQRAVNVSFLGVLESGEYIAELFYELSGYIPQGWWHGGNQPTAPRGTNFMVLGQILAPRDASGNFVLGDFSYRAIAGGIDPNSPTGISPTNYGEATTTRSIENSARILYSSIAGNLGGQLIAGEDFVRRNVQFSLAADAWRGTNVIPMAVQGHYVYLRAPYGILEIARDYLEVTWRGQSFTEGNGMTVTQIIDSTNSTVFRLALPYVTIGIFNENFGSNNHAWDGQVYSGMTVHFNVRALPQAATQSFPKNQVAMIVPMNPDIIPAALDGDRNATSIRDFTIDDGVNPVRVAPGMMVSGRSISAVNIQENAELQTWVVARSVDDTGALLATSSGHEWETSLGWLNLVPDGGIEKEFHYFNNTDTSIGQFHAFVPIPKAGEMMPLDEIGEPLLHGQLQREPFGFSLYLLNEVATIPGFTITYSLTYSFDVNFAGFLAWDNIAPSDRAEIRMVRIVSNRDIAAGESNHFLFELGHAENTLPYAATENRYAPLTHSSVAGNAAMRQSHPIAMRLWNYAIFHYNYARTDDGIFHYESVMQNATVSAPAPAPAREGYTFIRWTTDTANTTEYDFATPVTIPHLHLFAEWQINPNFDVTYVVTGDAPASFTPAIPSVATHREGISGITVAQVLTTTETTRTTIVDGEEVTENGTWTFNGWTAPTGLVVTNGTFTMPRSDVEFTGYWTFTPTSGGGNGNNGGGNGNNGGSNGNTGGGTPPDEPYDEPELIKNPDRMVVRVGETLGWTLRNFHNYTGGAVTNFTIVELPGRGLNFVSASLPAFANSTGVTFDVRYRVYGSNTWNTFATGVDASQPFEFNLPQSGNLHYTDIEFSFGNVPANFGLNNDIRVYFIVSADALNNELINRFIVMYGDEEREGSGTATIGPDTPHTGGGTGTDERQTVIGEDGVPLGEWIWNEDSEEWVFFEDTAIPLGLLQIPQTGLGTNSLSWFLFGLALMLMTILFKGRRKELNTQEHGV